jgi:hypothetical protein
MSRTAPRIISARRVDDIIATGSLHHATPSKVGRTRVLSVYVVAPVFCGYDFAGHVADTAANRGDLGVAL